MLDRERFALNINADMDRVGLDLAAPGSRMREALAYCARREHMRRTVPIALVVGVVLTTINQADVILAGDATATTWVKCALNFVVPFVVSNLGLLSGRRPGA